MLAHVLARGETARAHALLHSVIVPQQLQPCRLLRDSTAHWLTPSRALEDDLPVSDRDRCTATTAPAHQEAVRTAAQRHSAAGSGAVIWPVKRRNGGASACRSGCIRKSARSWPGAEHHRLSTPRPRPTAGAAPALPLCTGCDHRSVGVL
ncbi:hypothetical protein [Streptomyces sp. Wb2n-11]|uniref:hypothetical protein n=1 Tax=Streptomyces sp. Wb2n-11 TaxID=1030533 RepID=UPI00350E35CE